MTAYFGMTRVSRPQQGEAVAVSMAADVVGTLAAQLTKFASARGRAGRVVCCGSVRGTTGPYERGCPRSDRSSRGNNVGTRMLRLGTESNRARS
jgi:hypothetical protein